MDNGKVPDFTTFNEDETIIAGRDFARRLMPGDVVALYGELGSGKTEFVKGICNYFEVNEPVTSPTFSIMNQYNCNRGNVDCPVYHIDLYRINKKEELKEIGFEDCMFTNNAIKLVEWADKANNLFPEHTYMVKIIPSLEQENQRFIYIYH